MTKYILAIIALIIICVGYLLISTPAAAPATPTPQTEEPAPQAVDNGLQVTTPAPQQIVTGVTQITGQARGNWFFEGTFPMVLLDDKSNEVAYGIATAEDEWTTENYVPFAGEIDTTGLTAGTYFVMLKKDNPSGLPENDAQTVFPIVVK